MPVIGGTVKIEMGRTGTQNRRAGSLPLNSSNQSRLANQRAHENGPATSLIKIHQVFSLPDNVVWQDLSPFGAFYGKRKRENSVGALREMIDGSWRYFPNEVDKLLNKVDNEVAKG